MDLKALLDMTPWEWPEGAGAAILGVLRDTRAPQPDRIRAAELAGDTVVIGDELVHVLLSVLRNGAEPEPLRARAAISLGPVLEQSDTDGFEDPESALITEPTFREIKETLRGLYLDTGVAKPVKRRILEASVRAQQEWHQPAVRAAFDGNDEEWKLTAVFCMRFVHGFDQQILEALKSQNPAIHCSAVRAAGAWEVDAAWPHVVDLLRTAGDDKPLLLAAIEAAAAIRPQEAPDALDKLMESDDEEIADAVSEALEMAELYSGELNGEDDD